MMIEVEPRVAPFEPTTPIKPSEAIRLGCLIAPVQAFGSSGNNNKACAIGAMILGFGEANGDDGPMGVAYSHIGTERQSDCPECGNHTRTVSTIWHLNDEHEWPRERIADWLEGLGL